MKKNSQAQNTVTFIDPPMGWRYGFPKPIPDGWNDMTPSERNDWFVEQGYPRVYTEGMNYRVFAKEVE